MKNLIIVILVILFSTATISAQNNITHTRISIITCGAGDELYSLFGHTAIRIIDSTNNTDIVYNWGGFTFDQPNFYLKFLRGKLLYYSSADYFPDFMYEYIYEHRSVYEQVLNIDSAAKKRIINAVNFNMSGDNKFYKYDFLLDNCTTRVKNIIFENNKTATIKTRIVPEGITARDMIHYYLERGNQLWTELGIDILLGSRVDRPVSNDEAMFLPEFFMKGLDNTEISSHPFVKSNTVILQGAAKAKPAWKYLPLVVTAAVCFLLFFISTLKTKWAKTIIKFFDALLLYITGLIGVLILFMWFATDHTVCRNNLNIAWALPTNFIAAFCMLKKPTWLSTYFFIAAAITGLLLATWFWLPQQMNIALLPVILLLLNRYVIFTTFYKNKFIRAGE
jgi:hypothetical protein